MSPVAASVAYDEVAQVYSELFADAALSAEPVDRALISAMVDRLGDGAVIADLGCGPGHVTQFLRTLGAYAVGVDASAGLLRHARSAYAEAVFCAADITRSLFSAGALDGALLRFSLIHMTEVQVEDTLAAVAGALRPDGLVLISLQTTEREDGPPEPFDHKVTPGWRWPVDTLAEVCARHDLVEESRRVLPVRVSHRFPEAHLLVRSS